MLASALCVLVPTAFFFPRWPLSPKEAALSAVAAEPIPPRASPHLRSRSSARRASSTHFVGTRAPLHAWRGVPEGRGEAPAYTVEELPTLGGAWAEAYGINASGQVVGQAQTKGPYHAVLWQGGTARDLGTLPGGSSSAARSINQRGQIVGWADGTDGAPHAFLWTNGTIKDLGMRGSPQSEARGINNSGEITVSLYAPNVSERAFLFARRTMQDVGTLGGDESEACGINDDGQVVGWSKTSSGDKHAFVYRGGALHDLGTLGGPGSAACSLNRKGEVVGWASTGLTAHAFLSTRGIMRDLGTLGGGDSEAFGINDRGEVVGKARTSPKGYHAFLYRGGRMQDLNRLIAPGSGWVLVTAYGINDIGQVVGVGVIHGQRRAFLLTPITLARKHRARAASLR
jgi:probable HAF family extracellular repeat protein